MLDIIYTHGMCIVGMLAMLVSLITELIKNVGFFKRVPTDALVIVLSIVLSVVAYFAGAAYFAVPAYWYEVVGVVFGGFVVAYIAMYGWTKFTDLFNRFKQ